MCTEARPSSEAGFTLIEVLAAMIILAVGLLGLEALSIGVARSVTLADRQSEYVTLAGDSLESGIRQLRANATPTQFCVTLPRGDRLSREVTVPSSANGNVARVTVRALPNLEAVNAPKTPFVVTSSAFLPAFTGSAPVGSPCQ